MEIKIKKMLQSYFDYSNDETEKIVYILKLIFTDLSKSVLLLILFAIIGYHADFLVAAIYTMFLRVFSGGFHFKTYKSCLSFSTVYFSAVIAINNLVEMNSLIVSYAVFSVLLILLIAPIIPKERSKIKSIKYRSLKIKSFIFALTYIFIFLLNRNALTQYGLWVVIIQANLLLFQEVQNYVKTINQKNLESGI